MDVWLLVQVVAVLTDVVQSGEDGGVVPAPALVRHSSIPLAGAARHHSVLQSVLVSPAHEVGRISRVFGQQREERVICRTGEGQSQGHHHHQHHQHQSLL